MNASLADLCRSALQTGISLWLQSAVILGCGLIAAQVSRRRGPLRRASLLQAALAGAALGMTATVVTTGRVQPLWRVTLPALAAAPGDVMTFAPPPSAPIPSHAPPSAAPSGPAAPGPAPRKDQPPFTLLPPTLPGMVYVAAVGVWLGGTALLLLWLALCQAHLSRLRRRGVFVTDPAATDMAAEAASSLDVRPLPLIAVPGVRSPFLAGLRRPAIFLPASWNTDYDAATLHVILAHETAHHRRRDLLWTLLLRLTCALLWPQPLLWLLGRQLEHAAEEACDLLAVTPDLPARRYADCLLALADRALPSPAERTLAQGVVPVRSALGRRIQTLLEWRNHPMTTFSPRARAALAAAAVVVTCAALRLISAADTPQQAQAKQMQAKQITSISNLRQIGLAFIVYAQNHDDRLPDAAHWMDELSPFLTQSAKTNAERQEMVRSLFHDPAAPAGNQWSYAYNRALSGVPLSTTKDPSRVIVLFESTQGVKNANDAGTSLPHPGWHNGQVDVCCADGHVKSLSETQVAVQLSFQPQATLAITKVPVTGHLYDRKTGKPIVGAEVEMYQMGAQNREAMFSTTDGTGEFHSYLLPGTNYLIVDSTSAMTRRDMQFGLGEIPTKIVSFSSDGKIVGPLSPNTYTATLTVPPGFTVTTTPGPVAIGYTPNQLVNGAPVPLTAASKP